MDIDIVTQLLTVMCTSVDAFKLENISCNEVQITGSKSRHVCDISGSMSNYLGNVQTILVGKVKRT